MSTPLRPVMTSMPATVSAPALPFPQLRHCTRCRVWPDRQYRWHCWHCPPTGHLSRLVILVAVACIIVDPGIGLLTGIGALTESFPPFEPIWPPFPSSVTPCAANVRHAVLRRPCVSDVDLCCNLAGWALPPDSRPQASSFVLVFFWGSRRRRGVLPGSRRRRGVGPGGRQSRRAASPAAVRFSGVQGIRGPAASPTVRGVADRRGRGQGLGHRSSSREIV